MAILAIDTFQRPNANPLSGNWSTLPGVSALQIVNGLVESTINFDRAAIEFYNGITFPNDQYSQVVLAQCPDQLFPYASVCCRQSSSADTSYCAEVSTRGSNDPTAYMTLRQAGVQHILATHHYVWAPGDVLRLEVQGSTQRMYINGALLITTTDTTLTSGAAGLAIFTNDPSEVSPSIGPWQGGSLVPIQTYFSSGGLNPVQMTSSRTGEFRTSLSTRISK